MNSIRNVEMMPTYGSQISCVRIKPPLDDGEEKLLRTRSAEYGNEILLIASSDTATTCQFDNKKHSGLEHFLKMVFDPFDDGIATIHYTS